MSIFLFILALHTTTGDWINDILIPPNNPHILYVATMDGVYQKEGDTFKSINNGLLSLHITSLSIDKGNNLYASSPDGVYVLKAKRWKKILDEPFCNKLFIFNKTIIVGTDVGRVLRSDDGGASFECAMHLASPITAITSFNNSIYLSSYNSGIYESYDNGLHWKRLKCDLKGVWDILVDKGGIFIASENGLLKGSSSSWKALNNGLTTKDIRVIRKDKNALYLGTYIGGFFISYDNGKKWHPENTGLFNTNIRDIAIVGKTIYLATENGLYKKIEGQEKFERQGEGFAYPSSAPISKTPEEIKKRKERLGIKPPSLEKKGEH